jgi:hypothetical protein
MGYLASGPTSTGSCSTATMRGQCFVFVAHEFGSRITMRPSNIGHEHTEHNCLNAFPCCTVLYEHV